MGSFFGEYSQPNQIGLDARKGFRMSWFYNVETGDDILNHFRVYWKTANSTGWDDGDVRMTRVPASANFLDAEIDPEDTFFSIAWKVEAWAVDKRYDPNQPDPQYYFENEDDLEGELLSGEPKKIAENLNVFDAYGWELFTEANGVVTNGGEGSGTILQIPGLASEPGTYDVQISVANGFQWSTWVYTFSTLTQYDSRKWVKRAGRWWCVPVWKKTAGVMKEILP